jgi:hypothetical protein
MILEDKMCYSKLLWMQEQPGWSRAISRVSYTTPLVPYEGVAGYIETTVEIEVSDLTALVKIMEAWWSLSNDERGNYRDKAISTG